MAGTGSLSLEIELHDLLRFAHVLLFCAWLGADVGVFIGGGWMSRPGISVIERHRIRDVVMAIDFTPRLALVLMLPVGFTLALDWGAPLPAIALPWIWSAALAWFAMLCYLHFADGGAAGALLLRVDLGLRALLMAGMFWLALRAFAAPDADMPVWLGIKFAIFGAIVVVGLILRVLSNQWRIAIARFEAGDQAGGQALLRVRRRKAVAAALSMWALVAAAGFFGTVKWPGS